MCLTSVQASGTTFGNFLTKEGKTEQVTAGNLFWQMEVWGGARVVEDYVHLCVCVCVWWGQLSSPGSV